MGKYTILYVRKFVPAAWQRLFNLYSADTWKESIRNGSRYTISPVMLIRTIKIMQ